MKVSKVPDLKKLWKYKDKQRAKVARLVVMIQGTRESALGLLEVYEESGTRLRPESIEMEKIVVDQIGETQSAGGSNQGNMEGNEEEKIGAWQSAGGTERGEC